MSFRVEDRTLPEKVAALESVVRRLQTGRSVTVALTNGYQLLSGKGQPGGYASLGDDGLVPADQLPPTAADEATFLALVAIAGLS